MIAKLRVPLLVPAIAAPFLLAVYGLGMAVPPLLLMTVIFASVIVAVHHAEIIAHRLGEPFGTFVFAVAVTVIEVGLIVSVMQADPVASASLPRDTVMAAIMIILGAVTGLCLLIGGLRHGEQSYMQNGVSAALATLAALSVTTLVLPNFVISRPGPEYVPAQLAFVGVVALLLYGTFVLVQTVRHRDYFLPEDVIDGQTANEDAHAERPSARTAAISGSLLVVCLVAVVFLAKALAPWVEESVTAVGAPKSLVGVIIAGLVLLPEGIAAVRAAGVNRLQTSLNLALGSALATIGLTIPVVAAIAIYSGWSLTLGLNGAGQIILALTLLVSTLSLSTGRTTIMQGALHITLFAIFLFMLLVP